MTYRPASSSGLAERTQTRATSRDSFAFHFAADTDSSGASSEPPARGARRLIANRRYFGLDAVMLHAGAERVLARIAAQPAGRRGIDVRSLAKDFSVGPAEASALLSALVTGGLLRPDGAGAYQPTSRFRDYALASVVAPLSRARAKALIDRAIETSDRINAGWTSNPYTIDAIAVSGSYMSRDNVLEELSLWLVLKRREHRRSLASTGKEEALRQIGGAIKALSSFIVVRVVSDRHGVQRPFAIVYEADDMAAGGPRHAWDKVLEWSASVNRRLGRK